jgi:hypothetical protein
MQELECSGSNLTQRVILSVAKNLKEIATSSSLALLGTSLAMTK